jgi:hydroxyacylglutathione hydrolase
MSEDEFIDRVLEGQPPAPPYFGAMKLRNRDQGAPETLSFPRKLTVQEVQATLQPSSAAQEMAPTLIDVRHTDEWQQSHIAQATLIPLPELHTRLDEIPRDRPVIVHCQRGGRSAAAAATLDAFGFTDVHDVIGGFAAWQAAGLPVQR